VPQPVEVAARRGATLREAGETIGYVRVAFTDADFDAMPDSAPMARVGPCGTTDLDEQLRERGVDTLVLAGISTSGVLLSAVRDCHDRDYRLFVLADASADPDPENHELLTRKIFSRQAEVLEVADLVGLLA
jgi:nicotinamidase-related amidase